jgi:hypothetical protein
MENQLSQEQALGVLVQAAKVGQSKGAYSLEDAELIAKAIRVFTPKQQVEKPADEKEEKKASKKAAKETVKEEAEE